MTREQAIQKLLDCARAEIGYHEQGENLTKYAAQYDYDTRLYGFDMSGQPWCDYFVDWWLHEDVRVQRRESDDVSVQRMQRGELPGIRRVLPCKFRND